MIMDNNGLTGSFSGGNKGFKQTLNRLSETFENNNLNYAQHITTILQSRQLNEAYMNTLLEDYAEDQDLNESAEGYADFLQERHAVNYKNLISLFENSRNTILSEAQTSGSLKPIVGLTLPLLKLYWIKNIFKDFIPVIVAKENTVKIGIERQVLYGMDGKKYYMPEVFTDPEVNLTGISRQFLSKDPIAVPQTGYDLITQAGGSKVNDDEVSRLFFIDSIKYKNPAYNSEDHTEGAAPEYLTIKTRIKVDAGTGMFRHVIRKAAKAGEDAEIIDILMGDLDFKTGLLNIVSAKGAITAVTVDGSLSNENHFRVASVDWEKNVEEFTIPDGDHLATGLTEERIKDENVIYNIDSAAKVMQQMTDVIGQVKDKRIQVFLEESRDRIKGTNLFKGVTFDIKPPTVVQNITHTQWTREELKETIDKLYLALGQILQNEEITVALLANEQDARLLTEVKWNYGKNSEVGGCKLSYNFGVYNNDRNFIVGSSHKIDQGSLMLIVIPLTDAHMTYKLFEYQFFISNEYRHPKNVRIPSVMVSDRYLIDELIPIQGEVKIENNTISSSDVYKAGQQATP